MKIRQTPVPNLLAIDSERRIDERGSFARLFCQKELHEIMGTRRIVQANQSSTRNVGAVRGLHYQHQPHAEMKLVRCIKGKVWDVAVDLRRGSPSFLEWHAEELSPENTTMMIIPEGFAHGFQVLEADSQMLYFHTAYYNSSAEAGVQPTDPMLSIRWPLPVRDLSDRDLSHPLLPSDFAGLRI